MVSCCLSQVHSKGVVTYLRLVPFPPGAPHVETSKVNQKYTLYLEPHNKMLDIFSPTPPHESFPKMLLFSIVHRWKQLRASLHTLLYTLQMVYAYESMQHISITCKKNLPSHHHCLLWPTLYVSIKDIKNILIDNCHYSFKNVMRTMIITYILYHLEAFISILKRVTFHLYAALN